MSVGIGLQSFERLIESLEYGATPILQYKSIGYGDFHDEKVTDLLKLICTKINGASCRINLAT